MSSTMTPESETARPGPSAGAASPDASAAAPAAAPQKKNRILPVLAVLLVLGGGWFAKQWWFGRTHESTENAQVDGHIVPVLAKVGGYITSVNVNENERLPAGKVVITIDDAEYRARLAQAEADYAAALAAVGTGRDVGQALAAQEQATSQRAVTDAQITAARANYEKARSDLARMQELADKQIVSKQALDAAKATEVALKAQLEAVEKQAGGATAGVSGAQAGVRLAQARLGAAKAARDNAALQLSYTRIVVPASGIIARKQVEVGQLVQPGQALFSVVGDSDVWVTANMKETQLEKVKVGQKVDIEVDAYPGSPAKGVVESVSPATGARFALLPPDNATGNFTKVVQRVPVRIRVAEGPGPDKPLRPGMSVTVNIETR
ncbi:MAG: HlyD family secretion protein [Gemmatimonadetes bacterium]|nr:HlyD family secretion protein [Gemmatimonadota bacterium]